MKTENVRIGIIGFAREGKSLAEFLLTRLKGYCEITFLDQRTIKSSDRDSRFHYKTGKSYLSTLNSFDIVFRSPGVPFLTKEIQAAKKSGVAISSVTNIFFQEIHTLRQKKNSDYPKIIAVTGTKGKGTTSTLIYNMLKKAGKKAVLAGNIGVPMLDVLSKAKKSEFIVLELSSFQLQDLKHSADVAVLVPVSPDHLDHHKTMAEYVNAKAQLTKTQVKGCRAYCVAGNKLSEKIVSFSAGKKVFVKPESFKLFDSSDLSVPGMHNFENAVLAATVVSDLGIDKAAIASAAKVFKGLSHRLEFVRKVSHSSARVSVFDDSAGTNPITSVAAARAFSIPSIVMIGGVGKVSYAPLRELKKTNASAVVLFGRDGKKARKFIPRHIQVVEAGGKDFSKIVRTALDLSLKLSAELHSEVALLFSPASASFDMFENAYQRGDLFQEFVKKM
ncbi:MAG: UDP-N-acetylmuramoyl-L-alanine--D-glutamate ligase [Candidatus Paceibacterota bacterium]